MNDTIKLIDNYRRARDAKDIKLMLPPYRQILLDLYAYIERIENFIKTPYTALINHVSNSNILK